MASQPGVSRGWSSFISGVEQLAEQARREQARQAADRADLGETWTVLMTTVAGTLPELLTSARGHASQMLRAVR